MRRWWLLPLGITIVALAILALLRGGPARLPIATGPPPLDQIDEPSRERLDELLRDAEREERGR